MLGPLLFLVYIDSVASTVNHSKIIIYTDDITLYKIIRNPSDFTFLQEDVISICIWIADNYLTLNSQKSCYMLFSRRAHPTLPDSDLSVQDHQLLCRVSQFKYLGLNFSEDLSWSHHIHIQCKKSHKLLGIQFRHFYAHCNSCTLHVASSI